MALLTADQIRAAANCALPTEDVPVPEWAADGTVRVKTLSGKELDAFRQSSWERVGDKMEPKRENLTARLVALTCVDEGGNRLFSVADAEWLGGLSAAALNRVSDAAERLAGITPKAAEERAKNSDPASGDGSS
jgi:hypothetical protein